MIRYEDKITKETLAEQRLYRRVFCTPEGKKVFAHMMGYLGMYEPIREEHMAYDAAMRNVGTWLLEMVGVSHEDNLEALTENQLSVKMYIPEEEKEATNHGNQLFG